MRILFIVLDFISFIVAVFLGSTIRTGQYDYFYAITNLTVLTPSFFLSIFLLWIFSFYEFDFIHKKLFKYQNIILIFVLNSFLSAGLIYFTSTLFRTTTPKTNLFIILALYFLIVYITRKLFVSIRLKLKKINIVILGKSHTLDTIVEEISKYSNYNIYINSENVDSKITKIILKNFRKISFVIVSNELLSSKHKWQQDFLLKGLVVKSEMDFFEDLFSRVPKIAFDNSLWLLDYISSRNTGRSIKRAIDIFFSLLLFPFCFVASAIIYLLILIFDRQNPIFVQIRVGINGKIIALYKFRTMITGTEQSTKFGKILRRFRLDELPQLFNILMGDTSFVGPRPIWSKEYKYLNKYIHNHKLRNIVRPGITGWAQLNYSAPNFSKLIDDPNEENEANFLRASEKRLAYDLYYIKNQSISLDMEIFFKTIKRMFISDKKITK